MSTPEYAKSQPYTRVLKYVKPYSLILAIGLFAGVMTGGLFGASFFWIKGIFQPFEKKPQIVGFSKAEKEEQKSQFLSISDSTVQHVNSAIKKKPNTQLDSIVTIAESIGIKMQDDGGRFTLLGLVLFVSTFILLWFLKVLADFTNGYCMRWVGARVVMDMRNELFSKLLDQSLVFYGTADVGQLISRCIQDTSQIQGAITTYVTDMTSCPFQIIGCLSFIVYTSYINNNFILLILLTVGVAVILLPVLALVRRVKEVYEKTYQKIAEVVSKMHEVFSGIILVKACHTEKHEANSFHKVNSNYFRAFVRISKPELMMNPLTEFAIVAGITAFCAYSFINEVMLSDILTLVIPAILMYLPLKALSRVSAGIQQAMAAANRYFELIDTDTRLIEAQNPIRISEFKNEIKFENVSFSYDGSSKNILEKVNFTLKNGQMVAVVGETGSGKTTIANLLARFYDVSSGKITIDGIDIRELKISDVRDLIGIVTQNTILFNDTIASNIAYGNSHTSTEEIIDAARKANAHDFIISGNHEHGYETVVGEKGFKLSGGEKQRVAIARAILRNPPILILDEATSALDTVTEKLVQDALNKLMSNRTVFAIAHRLSTIKSANLILVLDKGRIVEMGTHEELIQIPEGRYKYFYDIQFSKEV